MFSTSQLITTPFGINVFGSSLIRAEPNMVSLHFAVSRKHQKPKVAFSDVKKDAQGVRNFLHQVEINEFGSSRVSIMPAYQYTAGVQKFIGYKATITFRVLLRQLDRLEDILVGIVDAGVNELSSVDYQTTRLKELRAEARRKAVEAAREKAENYCSAAGVSLSKVIHIDDVNPETLQMRAGHVIREVQPDDVDNDKVFDPGSITIGGAVMIAFEIASRK